MVKLQNLKLKILLPNELVFLRDICSFRDALYLKSQHSILLNFNLKNAIIFNQMFSLDRINNHVQ